MRKLSSLCISLFLSAAATPAALQAQTLSFSGPKQISAGALFQSGNFNGNGNTDLLISVGSDNKFLAGDGNGNFTLTGPISGLALGESSLVADVNGDGKDDFIGLVGGCPSSSGCPTQNGQGTLTVSLSQGNGVFTKGYVGMLPTHLPGVMGVVGDFNKDGRPDIAVLAFASGTATAPGAPPELCIFLNQGNGTFTQTDYQTPASLGGTPVLTNLVTGDFEGNGNQDIALIYYDLYGHPVAEPEVLTFAGDGKGGFGPGVVSYKLDSRLYTSGLDTLFAADLNGDGRTDLLTYIDPKIANGGVRVPSLLANTSGKFYWGSAVYLTNSPSSFIPLFLADFDGDGKPDLFAYYYNATNVFQATFYLGAGDGTFKTPHIPLTINGIDNPVVNVVPLKTGDLPSLIVDNNNGKTQFLELLINTTKR